MHTEKKIDLVKWAVVAVLAVLAAFHYRVMIEYTLHLFSKPVEDMKHGYLIPLVSAYLVWRKRDEWSKVKSDVSWQGLLVMVLFCVLAFFGSNGNQSRIEQCSLIGLIWAIPFALWGRGAAAFIAFPAAYLVFTIPISSFIDFCTVHLRLFSTTLSALVVNGLGLAVQQAGTTLASLTPGAEFHVDVAAGCSGIRSLFALLAFTAVWVHFFQRTLWRKALVVVSTVPVAILGNVIRLTLTCFAAKWFGKEFGLGTFHDYVGFPIFILEIFLVQLINTAISRRLPPPAAPEREFQCAGGTKPVAVQWLVILLVLAVGGWTFTLTWRAKDPHYNEDASFVARSLPDSVPGWKSDIIYYCQNPLCARSYFGEEVRGNTASGSKDSGVKTALQCPLCRNELGLISLAEKNELPKDTILVKRMYSSQDGTSIQVSVVIGGRRRGSIHRADLCLPTQGFSMEKTELIKFKLCGKSIVAQCITASRPGFAPFSLIYWMESEFRTTCSHSERIWLDIWDRSIHNAINRWVMISISISGGISKPGNREKLSSFLDKVYPQIILNTAQGRGADE